MPLDTAFAPPAPPGTAVARDRAVAVLDAATGNRVTVVVAPPGYGKTTLVAQWASHVEPGRVRWLTCRPGDDPATLPAQVSSLAVGVPDDPVGPAPVVVVDGLDRAPAGTLGPSLALLLERLPARAGVVLVTRVEPPLPFHRWRLVDELAEIGQDDLAFDTAEAAALVEQVAGRALPHQDVAALVAATEGWVVALRDAAVAVTDGSSVAAAVGDLTAPGGPLDARITETMLHDLPVTTRRFLASTSVLDRLSGSLCDHVTGGHGSTATLEELQRRSLFVVPDGSGPGWYRYHRLLRGALRDRLHHEDPTGERMLLHRAADWHLDRDDVEEAIGYLAEAEDWEEALDAANAYGGTLAARGQAGALAQSLQHIPAPADPHAGRAGGRRALLEVAANLLEGDTDTAAAGLEALRARPDAPPEEQVVTDLLQARRAIQDGQVAPAVAAADLALDEVESVDEPAIPNILGLTTGHDDVVAAAQLTRGEALMYHGALPAARRALDDARQQGGGIWLAYTLGSRALVDAASGRLGAAEAGATQALSLGREIGLTAPAAPVTAQLALANVARNRGDADRARTQLARVPLPVRHPTVLALVTVELALAALAIHGPEAGLDALRSGGSPSCDRPLPRAVRARRRAVEARLLMTQGDLDGAARALRGLPHQLVDVVAARIRLAVERGDSVAARALLRHWPASAEPRSHVSRLLWLGVLDQVDEDDTAALTWASRAVAEAEPEWNVGPFRAAGPHGLGLLRRLYRSAPTAFLRVLVGDPGTVQHPPRVAPELIEQLTDRESALLALLPSRLSNPEIAARLGVTTNTVKTHVKHIYRKLGVTGRSGAVAAAERLRLL